PRGPRRGGIGLVSLPALGSAATASGVVSIESSGFDNQIAVYSTSDCADLLSGNSDNYTLLGANDDFEGSNSASIYAITDLTEDDIYYIQVDGKNDGFFGEFTLYLKEWPLSANEINKASEIIKIYPNPNSGNFKIDLANLSDHFENLKIEILNTDGSLIKQMKGIRNQNEYDVSIDRKGLFIVRVITNQNQYSLPIIVK
ncbi:MAG: T9SS type A sorting domain-containing protein, partial [Bacteroidales bacterium]